MLKQICLVQRIVFKKDNNLDFFALALGSNHLASSQSPSAAQVTSSMPQAVHGDHHVTLHKAEPHIKLDQLSVGVFSLVNINFTTKRTDQ